MKPQPQVLIPLISPVLNGRAPPPWLIVSTITVTAVLVKETECHTGPRVNPSQVPSLARCCVIRSPILESHRWARVACDRTTCFRGAAYGGFRPGWLTRKQPSSKVTVHPFHASDAFPSRLLSFPSALARRDSSTRAWPCRSCILK